MAGRAAGAHPAVLAVHTPGGSAEATRAAGVFALAVVARGVLSAVARLAPAVVLTVAGHFAATVPVAARWATGVLPAVAARPARSVHAAHAVTAARPA